MKNKFYLFTLFILCCLSVPSIAQVVFWTENFNNGCTSNCNVSGFSGVNGAWSVSNSGVNGNIANAFFVSCAENGEPAGSCGAGCGNDATLHVGSVPCLLCLFCPNGDCGASYNAGPAFSGEDPLTDIRAESPVISTIGKSNITISFDYIERGQGTSDDGSLEYSINGGAAWSALTNPAKTPNICPGGQGLWTTVSYVLPSACDNINNLKIGFRWKNNSDGVGNDPSFAINNVELSTQTALPPVADFSTAVTTFCDSTCIGFTDLSQNSPVTWNWLFPGATPATFSGQSPVNICYNTPGVYDVTLIAGNGAGTDTIVKSNFITVNSCFLPQVSFSATDTFFCEKGCIDFFDQTTNNPITWMWYFTGASPDTSSLQNPVNICYYNYGTFPVKLVATNIIGTDSVVFTSYITVNQNPPTPTATLSGGNILTCSPFSQYQWYFNGNLIPGATNQVHLAQATGNYFVVITDSNGCISSSSIVFVAFPGINEASQANGFEIHPNPASDILTIHCNNPGPVNGQIAFSDMSGRLIFVKNLSSMADEKEFQTDISALEKGIYILTFKFDKITCIKKLLKL